MSTQVRDFSSPEGRQARAATFQSDSRVAPPASPVTRDNPDLDRRGSVQSRFSTGSLGDNVVRNRRMTRSNTVTTYHEPEHPNWQPGAEPGIDAKALDEHIPPSLFNLKANCDIKIIDFSETDFTETIADNGSLEAFLHKPRPEEMPCRWVSVNGLSWDVIRTLGKHYNLHRLAIEDMVQKTRTKVDWYADNAFICLTLQKLVVLHQHSGSKEKCDCNDSMNEKFETDSEASSRQPWWKRAKRKPADDLPMYLDRNRDGKIDEFVSAHSSTSEASPIMPVRTLHRFESSQVPEHIAWMERHSALSRKDYAVSVERVFIFLLADNCVLSLFEQSAQPVEDPIMNRLRSKETILRRSVDASLLTQAIIDAIVDLAGPVKEAYNEARKRLQIDALTNPDVRTSRALHIFGEEIDMLQNLFKPIVHLVNALRDHNPEPPAIHSIPDAQTEVPSGLPPHSEPRPDVRPTKTQRDRSGELKFTRSTSEFRRTALKRSTTVTSVVISPLAHTYFGDVLDHCITMISALEQMDASAANISTLIFNTVGAKTNNFMMILAVVTVFFAPLTFISGYFGMNFSSGAGLAHPFGFFWIVAIPVLVAFMLLVFATMLWDNIVDFVEKRGVRATMNLSRGRSRY